MAQTGFTPISLYYSATTTNAPSAGNLVAGEIALNTADGKLFYKDSSNAVQVLATKGGVGSSTTTQVLYNNSGLVVGSANLTFNGTTLTTNTLGAFTLAGTVAGAGNQINNVVIGASTPLAGSFTTLTTSGVITDNNGTANGVTYLNASKVVTSGSALVFDGTNLGLGVTPSASSLPTFQAGVAIVVGNTETDVTSNAYYNSGWKYAGTGLATQYQANSGLHKWYNAPSGTAGNPITFTQAMTLDSSGNLLVGATTALGKLTVAGGDASIYGITVGRGGGAVSSNTAVGAGALASNTTGYQNIASGQSALYSNTTGSNNTASGVQALYYSTTGNNNTASGVQALYYSTTGSNNVASGFQALFSNATGSNNVASGFQAFFSNTTGGNNTASGAYALYSNTTGGSNTASGLNALYSNTTGSGNTALNPMNSGGSYAPVFNTTTENNRFCMGSTGVTNAYIQVAWTVVSDARDKTDFAPVPHGLDFVTKLKPTAYRYKMTREDTEGHGPLRYGFKAQEVLALEGDSPVVVDAEDAEKLRFNDQSMIAILVNAITELKAEFDLYKSTHH